MKKKGFNSDYSILIIFIATALVILIPFVLYQQYKGSSSIDLSSMLSYYGSIFGGLATLIAVLMSIHLSKAQIEEDRILSCKPYLQASYKPYEPNNTSTQTTDLKEIYLNVDLTTNQINSSYEFLWDRDVSGNSINSKVEKAIIQELHNKRNYYSIEYTLTNVGAGNAVNLITTINGEFNYASPHMAIPVNKRQTLFIRFSNMENKLEERCITFLFRFSDIYSKVVYEQTDEIFINRVEGKVLSSRQEKTMKPPIELLDYTIEDLLKLI
ncbi:hypothetical protein [Acetobacterium sp.]|uniref:hypothetical protein n=1 Tax=Acetobacterium sp. TaxID=1872094 RepID=UPI002F406813